MDLIMDEKDERYAGVTDDETLRQSLRARIEVLEKVAMWADHTALCTQKTQSHGCTCGLLKAQAALDALKEG